MAAMLRSPYMTFPGYHAWLYPAPAPRREPQGFFPLILQTINTPWPVEHPKIVTWATLLWTGYGAKYQYRGVAAFLAAWLSWQADIPVPLGLVTAFLAGTCIDRREWKYVVPALTKIYGFDPLRNTFRNDNQENITGFVALETVALLMVWVNAWSTRRFWAGSPYSQIVTTMSLVMFSFWNKRRT